MALALAVSLWIGGSGVAWAEEAADVTVTGVAPNDLTTLEGAGKLAKNQDGYYYDWHLQSPYKKLEITGGDYRTPSLINFAAGYSSAGAEINGYTLTVKGGTFCRLYGGYSTSGSAKNNRLIFIDGDATDRYIYGGFVSTGNGVVQGNVLEMQGGTVRYAYGGSTGGSGEAGGETPELGNSVSVSGGTVTEEVTGGYSSNGMVRNNKVTISGNSDVGTVKGGASNSGDVSGNKVTVTGGKVTNIYGGNSIGGEASGNEVIISGGTVKGDVYGVYGGYSGYNNANNNKVTISGDANFAETARIYGGYSFEPYDHINNIVTIKREGLKVAHIGVGKIEEGMELFPVIR